MNPILLKPESSSGAQVIVQGQRHATMSAREGESYRYAEALRGVLRLDPDYVFVGEVRDAATALAAGRASALEGLKLLWQRPTLRWLVMYSTITGEEACFLKPLIPDWPLVERDGVPRLERVFRFPTYPAALAFQLGLAVISFPIKIVALWDTRRRAASPAAGALARPRALRPVRPRAPAVHGARLRRRRRHLDPDADPGAQGRGTQVLCSRRRVLRRRDEHMSPPPTVVLLAPQAPVPTVREDELLQAGCLLLSAPDA